MMLPHRPGGIQPSSHRWPSLCSSGSQQACPRKMLIWSGGRPTADERPDPMLCTKQPVLRRFWYATVPVDKLKDGPKPFTLLGENIVLFLDAEGNPAALADRCCHRTAKLSKGWSEGGLITCGYHGWTYDGSGKLMRIPQFAPDQPVPDARVKAFRCDTRYGYAWVALEEPLLPIPDLPQERDPAYRRIHQFDDRWNTAALRMMENSFDNAHFSFVHKSTFGQQDQPRPERYELIETADGFR